MADLVGNFIVGLFLLLAAAVLVGELATRFGQAALVGQLAVGVILGPTILGPFLGLSAISAELTGIQFLATFFILVMAGLEISPEELYASGLPAVVLGLSIFLGPFALGAVVVHLAYPTLSLLTALFVSLTLSITALPVMGVMLGEFKIGRTKMGTLLLNTAVVNELAAVSCFAVLLRLQGDPGGGWIGPAIAVVSVGLFLAAVLTAHMVLRLLRESPVWNRLKRGFRQTWRSKEAGFAVLMVMALGSALFSQFLGLTFLVGAFYAGLLITPESAGHREHRSLRHAFDAITWGFFIPLFFAFVGLGMNLRTLAASEPALVTFLLLIAFALGAKLVIGTFVARRLGWPSAQARAIGFLVSSRGAVELAMAVILLEAGVFTTPIYTVVAGVGLVTTVIAPIGARRWGRLPTDEPVAEGLARPTGHRLFARPLRPADLGRDVRVARPSPTPISLVGPVGARPIAPPDPPA
ncbi:MAG: cation:proton antiporter [Thermoplasmata archaeon]